MKIILNFHDFPRQIIKFHEFSALENEILKFHDFPGDTETKKTVNSLSIDQIVQVTNFAIP